MFSLNFYFSLCWTCVWKSAVCHCLFILIVVFACFVVLCKSFSCTMRFDRFVFCSFVLVIICFNSARSDSSIKQHRDALIARLLLKGWRKKAEEQRVRLFDRLPQSVESKYTPVNLIDIIVTMNDQLYYFLCVFLVVTDASHLIPRIPLGDSPRDYRRWVLQFSHFNLLIKHNYLFIFVGT